jgi:O-antigen ligase
MILANNKVILGMLVIPLVMLVGVISSILPLETLSGTVVFLIVIVLFMLLFKNTKKTISLLSTVLILSLFLIPGFNYEGIGFRLDDLIVVLMSFILFIILFQQKKIKMSPIIKCLVAYLMYSFLISVVHILLGELRPIYMLFFIKEIQYFIYFLSFYYMAMNNDNFSIKVEKVFVFSSLATLGWGVYQLITGNIVGYYGIGIISISAPSQSGVVLMVISIFMLYMSIYNKRRSLFYTLAFFLASALTFATISRTGISILIALLGVYLLISMFRKWNAIKVLIGGYLIVLLVPLAYLLVGDLVKSILERFSRFNEGASGRIGFWQHFLSQSDTMGHIFGNGKGFMQVIVGTFTLKADSQYVRLILEVGIVGLILWVGLISSILIFSIKNMKNNYHDSLFLFLLTVGFILIGVTQEGYLVAIQGSLYWILTGLFIGKISRKNKIENDFI